MSRLKFESWMRLYFYACKAKEKEKNSWSIYILVIYFCMCYILYYNIFFMLLQSPVLGEYTYKS
jgi:hypothetical protein